MESEANLSSNPMPDEAAEQSPTNVPTPQEAAATESAEAPAETEAMTEEASAADAPSPIEESPQVADAPTAVEEPAAEEAPTEGAPAEETAQQAEENVIVATEDVAPAQSRIELAKLAKESLIERAKELADSTEWRKASDAQRVLMQEWRAAGYAGNKDNDRLWEEFRAARDQFYSRRDAHYAELRAKQAEVIEAKKQIIEEARELTANVENWVKTSDALNALMERWKAAGNAGRDNEHVLWEEFNGIRRDFRNRRKADLAERRAKERACADAKRKIIAEATAIAEAKEYSRENSDRMRQLNDEYKAAGFAGRPANDTLWQEFRTVQNAYWDGNSAHREQQRRERSERLSEAVERKSGQIEHLKDQNETLTTRLESTLNPEKVAQIKRWIEENEQRLDGLKDDIDEIKRKI